MLIIQKTQPIQQHPSFSFFFKVSYFFNWKLSVLLNPPTIGFTKSL